MGTEVGTGTILGGRYLVGERIGQGGMGTVYTGTQIDLGRRVAIKVLLPELTADAEMAGRFEREAKAAAGLGHPNIVQVTDYGAAPGEPAFLVMELLSGRSLAQVIETEGRLSPTRVAFIASQVLSALEMAHAAGIVHRDIKPDNVFLTSVAGVEDVVKVLDFGVAKLLGPVDAAGPTAVMTTVGGLLGTPHYMAPEQARGLEVDPRTDVYAVGACMYRALTGRLPLEAHSLNALLFAIAEQAPIPVHKLRGEVDLALSQVIERALAKKPDDRFATAADMRRALVPWTEHAVSAREAPSEARTNASSAAAQDGTLRAGYVLGAQKPSPPEKVAPAPLASAPPPKSGARVILVGLAALAVLAALSGVAFFVGTSRSRDHGGGEVAVNNVRRASDDQRQGPIAATAAPSASGDHISGGETSATVAASSASAAPPLLASAPPPPVIAVPPPTTVTKPTAKATGAATAVVSGLSTNNLFEIDEVKRVVATRAGAINACYAAAQFDPVDHQYETFHITVADDGKVTGVVVSGLPPFAASLDACMIKVLFTLPFGAPANNKGGTLQVGFRARVKS
jgi:serine/threonine protein kinase